MTDKWPTDAMIRAGLLTLLADVEGDFKIKGRSSDVVRAIYLAMEAARPDRVMVEVTDAELDVLLHVPDDDQPSVAQTADRSAKSPG